MIKKLSDGVLKKPPTREISPPKGGKSVKAYAIEMRGPKPDMRARPTPMPFDTMLAARSVFQVALAGKAKDAEGKLVTVPKGTMIAVLSAEMRKVECEYESVAIQVRSNLSKDGLLDMLPGRRFLALPEEVTPDTVYDYLMKCMAATPVKEKK